MPPDVHAIVESVAIILLSEGLKCTSHTLTDPATVGDTIPLILLPLMLTVTEPEQPSVVPVTVNVVVAVGFTVTILHVVQESPVDGDHE